MALPLSTQDLVNDFLQRAIPFDTAYENWKFEIAGCPEAAKRPHFTDMDRCDPKQGTFSTKHWLQARKEAAKLWDLVERKEDK
jgi:hypothetical protein